MSASSLDDTFGALTARQREILVIAVEEGYYTVLRETTHERIAEQLDVEPGTVGEHLRKVEARVLSELVSHRC